MRTAFWLPAGIAIAMAASANEVTIKNDSLDDGGSGTIQAGFVASEKAAAWLTTPCDGNVVAVQVFWQSLFGGAPFSIEDSIDIYRDGTFPTPGALAEQIVAPALNDGVLNEYRWLDENSTVPLLVPVVAGETFVVALTFAEAPDPTEGPSVIDDGDGAEPNRDAIYAFLGAGVYQWFANPTLGVNGDWVIRAVVDCEAGPAEADVGVTMSADPPQYTAGAPLTYAITIANAGPAAAPGTTVVDAFPPEYLDASWTCAGTGGATCAASGSGTIGASVNLPAGSQIVYTVDGTVADDATAPITNSATAVVAAPVTDPDGTDNTATLPIDPAPIDDTIFADGFDPSG